MPGELHVQEFEDYVLTHLLTPFGPVPTVNDPDGIYPYTSYCETSHRPAPKKYRFVRLENKFVSVTICPDLGGKVYSLVHKGSGREVLYVPGIVRHTRILPRFYFVAGGIEVSFPISHSPTQNEPVLYKVEVTPSRIYVTCGERELRFGMQWSVEYSLGANDPFLTQRAIFANPGTEPAPWMSWSNAALPSAPDTEFHFPKGRVLSHSSKLETIDWGSEGPARESDVNEMTGYFWETSDVNAFGAFTPSFGTGLYHIAERGIAEGTKLWTYGNGGDREWSMLSTAERCPYIEIQGGPIKDQSIKLDLHPGEKRSHIEYWIPADLPLDIYRLEVPPTELRPVDDVPLFSWARPGELTPWLMLVEAHAGKTEVPLPPPVHLNNWPPTGLEQLDEPFRWAIVRQPGAASLWKYYFGTWLAAKGRMSEALEELSGSSEGLAALVTARIRAAAGDHTAAADAIRSVKEPWLAIHPQVVVERDKILRMLGSHSIDERGSWLEKVDALEDEWVVERRIQLLIDSGMISEAEKLLLTFPFQKVHQSYYRTSLWYQICEGSGIDDDSVPAVIGEDRLATFGAYRDFAGK